MSSNNNFSATTYPCQCLLPFLAENLPTEPNGCYSERLQPICKHPQVLFTKQFSGCSYGWLITVACYGQRGNGTQPMDLVIGKCRQIGLDSRTSARV